MRYTEARLTAVAEALLDGIDEDAVDFRPTYDGAAEEPIVLPGGFPEPAGQRRRRHRRRHGDLDPAAQCRRAVRRAAASDQDAQRAHRRRWSTLVKGPDFPTGGILVEPRESIVEAYKTGRGAFRLRARWEKEELPRGQYLASSSPRSPTRCRRAS